MMANPLILKTSPSKKITTEGDMMINTITALGDLSNVTQTLISTIDGLSEFVCDNVKDKRILSAIKNRVKLIKDASTYVDDKVNYIVSQSGRKNLILRTQSRKRAAQNMELIIAQKTKRVTFRFRVLSEYQKLHIFNM